MKKYRFNDINDPKIKFSLVESAPEVDGEYILAKVRGVFFCPDGMSRNGRYYPKELWERVLSEPEVQSRLKNKNMFGTVGHETTIDDKAVLEGLVSHIVTNLEINENNEGIGEALILNTPAGRTLNTILRAGGKMYVSTRANGTLSNETYKGKPIVDVDTYEFQTVDFVCRPGFLEANPSIAEDLNKLIEDNTKNGEVMSEQLIKLITDENAELKQKVSSLTDEIKELKENHSVTLDENKHLTGELSKLEEANKIIDQYNELGESFESIKEALELGVKNAEMLSEFLELGNSVESVKKALEESEKFISTVNEEFGTIDEIRKAFNVSIDFKESIDELGTIDEITEMVEELTKISEEKEKLEKEQKANALAEELNLPVEKINTLLEKYSEEDVKELYSELSESNSRYIKPEGQLDEGEDNDVEDNEDDDELYESKILSRGYAERING